MNSYTVVIPVHNGAATIFEALSSLERQTILPKKILIFDNNSSDDTLREVRKFEQTSQIPIQVERSDVTLPPHESFACSIKNIDGRFIWLAADDMLFPWTAEKMLGSRCSPICEHSISGSSLFIKENAQIIRGISLWNPLSSKRFLRNPADNPIVYGMHVSSRVKEYFPKEYFPAWDWNFSFFCVKDKIHVVAPLPTHFREYTPITPHRLFASSQKNLRKYFPYIGLSKSILKSLNFQEMLPILSSLLILNIKGFLIFGKFSTRFEEVGLYNKLNKIRILIKYPKSFAKNNALLRALYAIIPPPLKNLIKKAITPAENVITPIFTDVTRLIDPSATNYRTNLLSINNAIRDFYCVPRGNMNSAQVIEMCTYFLRFADVKSKLVIDPSFISINLNFIEIVVLGLKRIFPNGDIQFRPIRHRGITIQNIEEFYAKIWASDFERDIKYTFSQLRIRTFLKKTEVNVFLPEIPQPNRDAGSIDILYILSILKRLGVNVNIYLPHFVTTNPIARATLREFGRLVQLENFEANGGVNLVYGPYAYQSFAPYLLEKDFVYIMVDAVFRRAAQSKTNLSNSDKLIIVFEAEALRSCKYALSISEPDRMAVIQNFPLTNVLSFPIMRFARTAPQLNVSRSTNLLFIGSLVHTPNKIAAEWLVKKLAPLLFDANPDIRLLLAGQGSEMFDNIQKNVRGLGLVPDLRELYSQSFATIAPMEIAAGINGKVIESLCYQVPPIISDSVSVNLPKGLLEYCEVAHSENEYVDIANKLFFNRTNGVKRQYQLKEVDGTSNVRTLLGLLKEH